MKLNSECSEGGQATEVSHDECRCCVSEDNTRTVDVDFGKTPVDSTIVKSLKITNDTCNEETYEVHRDPTTNPLDLVFHFNKYSWSLVPDDSGIFQIRYNPSIPNGKSVDYFTIVNNGRTILKLITRGTSIGPNASISIDELSMICSPNESTRKRVKIVNESVVPANFMFDVDAIQSSFKPDPTEGCIGANSYVYIVITFEPKFQGYHVCLLPCLIHHQAPILIRLYGYCDKRNKGKKDFTTPNLVYPPFEKNTFKVYMSDCNQVKKIESTEPCHSDPISLSSGYIDFGRFDPKRPGNANLSPQTTCLTNHTFMDMLFKWHEDVDGVFSLAPNSSRVRGGKTCLIEVQFDPSEENTFYEREFKALVFYVQDNSSVPIFLFPMVASIRVIGHTFPADSSSWIPQYHVPRNIIMPPCLPSSPVYATFVIKKFGHLPIMYRFIPPSETCFTLKPMQGIIRKNYQVIVVEMFPKIHNELLYERWAIRFNGNPDYETFVDFQGYADYPCLKFSVDFVEFSSTYPGCEQTEQFFMLNPTRHEINYKFLDIPSVLSVDEVEGKIGSNEILTHNWIFCPPNEGDYEFIVWCTYSTTSSSARQDIETVKKIELGVVGKCETGCLVATPSELNFDEQPYDEPIKFVFELTNLGNVEIPYLLTVENENWPHEEKSFEQRVQLDPLLGNLFPGDREQIRVTLVPRERGYHELSIRYSVRKNFQTDRLIATNEPAEICRLRYFCQLPLIKIEDLLHYRIGNGVSKFVLWRLLNVNKLNQIINDLQPGESHNLTMHVPPMIVQNDTSIVKLFISNPTSAVSNWSLKQIKLCSCSRISEKRGLTFHSMKYNCPHRKLCTFHPKSGTLEAREKAIINMELRYEILGETVIKWDLEIGYDRHVYICVSVNCLSGLEKTAFPLYGSIVELKNIYIGDFDPINQIFWIYNPTINDISYTLDTAPLKTLNEHHDFEIFHCDNPSGIVEKLSYEPLFIKFQPREWGLSEVTVPLTIGNELTEITIKGECTNDQSTNVTKFTTPRHDLFQISQIPVHFNTDIVDLSRMPLHSRTTRIIMIHNRLEHELVAYKWNRYELTGILEVDLEPETGRIQPGSLQTFRLIVTTGGKPCKINAGVTCEFINQSKKRAYERSVLMNENLCHQMKDYFTITEKGTTFPKPKEILPEEPEPFHKVLTVRCYTYSLQDEETKTLPEERLKNTPPIETPIEKPSTRFSFSRENTTLQTFILEGMIWNILQSPNVLDRSKSVLRYSQIVMKPLERERIQRRSYVKPSSRIIEKLLENMIFMIVHKEFALDMTHLTRKSDARQATYPKIWQQIPDQ